VTLLVYTCCQSKKVKKQRPIRDGGVGCVISVVWVMGRVTNCTEGRAATSQTIDEQMLQDSQLLLKQTIRLGYSAMLVL